MPDPTSQTAILLEKWSEVGNSNLERVSRARRLSQQNRYTSTDLISDLVGSWFDAWGLWWPSQGAESFGVPIAHFVAYPGDDAAHASVVVASHGGAPEATDLLWVRRTDDRRRDAQFPPIPAARMLMTLDHHVLGLRLCLSDLDLEQGRYRGQIFLDEHVLAVAYVDVWTAPHVPEPPPAPGPPGGDGGSGSLASPTPDLSDTVAAARKKIARKKASAKKSARKKTARKKSTSKKTAKKKSTRKKR